MFGTRNVERVVWGGRAGCQLFVAQEAALASPRDRRGRPWLCGPSRGGEAVRTTENLLVVHTSRDKIFFVSLVSGRSP